MSEEPQVEEDANRTSETDAKVAATIRAMKRRRWLRVIWLVLLPATLVSALVVYRTLVKPFMEKRAHLARVARQIPVFEAQLVELRRCLGGGGDEPGDFPVQVVRQFVESGIFGQKLSQCLNSYTTDLWRWMARCTSGAILKAAPPRSWHA